MALTKWNLKNFSDILKHSLSLAGENALIYLGFSLFLYPIMGIIACLRNDKLIYIVFLFSSVLFEIYSGIDMYFGVPRAFLMLSLPLGLISAEALKELQIFLKRLNPKMVAVITILLLIQPYLLGLYTAAIFLPIITEQEHSALRILAETSNKSHIHVPPRITCWSRYYFGSKSVEKIERGWDKKYSSIVFVEDLPESIENIEKNRIFNKLIDTGIPYICITEVKIEI